MAQSGKDDCPWTATRGTREKRTRTCIMMGGDERVGTLHSRKLSLVDKNSANAIRKGMTVPRQNPIPHTVQHGERQCSALPSRPRPSSGLRALKSSSSHSTRQKSVKLTKNKHAILGFEIKLINGLTRVGRSVDVAHNINVKVDVRRPARC
jgi:hypothetical protein